MHEKYICNLFLPQTHWWIQDTNIIKNLSSYNVINTDYTYIYSLVTQFSSDSKFDLGNLANTEECKRKS